MSVSRLEDLPDKILRKVLSNFSPKEILQSWSALNERFDKLIWSMDYLVSFIGGNVTNEDLRACLALRDRISSLSVSERWCRAFPEFRCIRALRILGFVYSFKFSQIQPAILPFLERIRHLNELSWNEFMGADDEWYAKQMLFCCAWKLIDVPSLLP